jgi:hypothetical protein
VTKLSIKQKNKTGRRNMEKTILDTPVRVKNNSYNTLNEAGVKIYQASFFAECLADIADVAIDSASTLVTQALLSPSTSLEIVAAIEKCRLMADISKNQLAWFLLNNKECDGWFIAHFMDDIRTKEDEEDSLSSENGERYVLRTVRCSWIDDGWELHIIRISYPDKWRADYHYQVISRDPYA